MFKHEFIYPDMAKAELEDKSYPLSGSNALVGGAMMPR